MSEINTQGRYLDVPAHPLIAKTAVELAQEVYETLCSGSNAIYKVNGDRNDFIRTCAPTLKQAAITLLASMLGDPKVSAWEKEQIHEALVLDNALPKTGVGVLPKKLLR